MQALLHLDVEALPRTLAWDRPLSDDEFEALCFANDVIQFERTKEGEIRMNPPASGFTGSGNAEINRELGNWWAAHKRGRVFDSSTGFFLADGSMLSPDAAYVLPKTLKGVGKKELERLPHLCPDFVIELLSKSDRLREAKDKMESWIANGAALAWLIDPYKKRVFVYSPGLPAGTITGNSIQGVGPVEGFTLDLGEVWRCYEI